MIGAFRKISWPTNPITGERLERRQVKKALKGPALAKLPMSMAGVKPIVESVQDLLENGEFSSPKDAAKALTQLVLEQSTDLTFFLAVSRQHGVQTITGPYPSEKAALAALAEPFHSGDGGVIKTTPEGPIKEKAWNVVFPESNTCKCSHYKPNHVGNGRWDKRECAVPSCSCKGFKAHNR